MNKHVKTAVVAVGLIGAAIAGALTQDALEQPEIEYVNVEVPVNVSHEVIVEVPVDREVIVEKEVLIDNGNLDLVLEDVFGDLDADEKQEVIDTIVFKNDVTVLAERLVKEEIVAFMEDEDMFDVGVFDGFRDNDVESVTVYEDETSIEDVDFEDKDATVFVEAKLRLRDGDDKLRVKVRAEVEVNDNELEIVDVEVLE